MAGFGLAKSRYFTYRFATDLGLPGPQLNRVEPYRLARAPARWVFTDHFNAAQPVKYKQGFIGMELNAFVSS